MNILDLPTEMLCIIMGHLSFENLKNMREVCKLFEKIVNKYVGEMVIKSRNWEFSSPFWWAYNTPGSLFVIRYLIPRYYSRHSTRFFNWAIKRGRKDIVGYLKELEKEGVFEPLK